MINSEIPLRITVRDGERIRINELQVGDEFLVFEAEGEVSIGTYIAASEPTMLNEVWGLQVKIKESV